MGYMDYRGVGTKKRHDIKQISKTIVHPNDLWNCILTTEDIQLVLHGNYCFELGW